MISIHHWHPYVWDFKWEHPTSVRFKGRIKKGCIDAFQNKCDVRVFLLHSPSPILPYQEIFDKSLGHLTVKRFNLRMNIRRIYNEQVVGYWGFETQKDQDIFFHNKEEWENFDV